MIGQERLKDIINNHFTYEVIELANCKEIYKGRVPSNLVQAFVNMGLEHTLLHSRVLYEFYFRLERRENPREHPRANMFVTDFRKPDFATNITETFWEKVNNQILHLGVNRTGEPSEKFTIPETIGIANDILMITKDFLIRLEPVNEGFFWGDKLRELKSNIDHFVAS